MKPSTERKLKRMLVILSELATYKPSMENLATEIGGRKKGKKQIEDVKDGRIVKDDIETGHGIIIPLWHFGMNY